MSQVVDGNRTLTGHVARATDAILDACTRCGACVEVCPVVPFADLARANTHDVVTGVLDVLSGAPEMPELSARWAHQCNGCGACIPACPEAINPRQMVMLAATQEATHSGGTSHLFRKMSRAIRVLAAMQMVPADVARLLQPPRKRDADAVFYLGCNAIRTPHILFNAMTILDALEVDYEVLGGSSACCGIIHSKWEGRLDAGGRVTESTLRQFGEFQPKTVLNWCPSCELHLGETIEGYRETSFDFDHITKFLLANEADLQARLTAPVNMRVLLHVHDGMRELGTNVERLLAMIPGLEIVDTVSEPGYTCGGSGADRSPALKAHRRTETVRRASDPGIDALVSLYHGCHGQLATAGKAHGFEVVNFTDLLVLGLGQSPREDALEAARAMDDWRAVAEHFHPSLTENGINIDVDTLAELLPDLMSSGEFRGGLQSF